MDNCLLTSDCRGNIVENVASKEYMVALSYIFTFEWRHGNKNPRLPFSALVRSCGALVPAYPLHDTTGINFVSRPPRSGHKTYP